MNSYLLDTSVISEVRKPRPHGGVLAWLGKLRAEQLFVSAVTMGELQDGIERTRRQDAAKAAAIESWADQVEASHQVLSMDSRCFRACARITQGMPDQVFEDAMIAATALMHNLIVATRNERVFAHFDVRVFNPFKTT